MIAQKCSKNLWRERANELLKELPQLVWKNKKWKNKLWLREVNLNSLVLQSIPKTLMIKSKIKSNWKLTKRDLLLVISFTMIRCFHICANGCSKEMIKILISMIKIFLNKMLIFSIIICIKNKMKVNP